MSVIYFADALTEVIPLSGKVSSLLSHLLFVFCSAAFLSYCADIILYIILYIM
jgi:hypothetical protein